MFLEREDAKRRFDEYEDELYRFYESEDSPKSVSRTYHEDEMQKLETAHEDVKQKLEADLESVKRIARALSDK